MEVDAGVGVRLQVAVLQHVPHQAEGEAGGQDGLCDVGGVLSVNDNISTDSYT